MMDEMAAEDSVVAYLGKRPGREAIAANAAKRLFSQWEIEREQMLRRGDPRPVYIFGAHEFAKIHAELDRIASRSPSDPAAEQCVIKLLAHLPPDAAAWRAIKVARYEGAQTGALR
jgi:hypothetical protein